MQRFLIIFALIASIYFAVLMGMFLRYKDELLKGDSERTRRWGMAWHGWGWVIRLGIVILITPVVSYDLWLIILNGLCLLLLNWVIYDFIINWFRGKDTWYVGSLLTGTESLWDRLTHRFSKPAKVSLIIAFAIYTTVYFIFIH